MTEDTAPPMHWIDRYTRYVLAGYLRHVAMVASVLLIIALTIDLWPQIDLVAGPPGGGIRDAAWHVLRFSALRAPGLIAPLLPFSTYLGVAWAEIAFTRAGERMFVWNTGRSPLQCLPAALLLGVILGPVEFVLDAYLGPAAMAEQMRERLGLDGQRLDRTRVGDTHWIASSTGLLKAEIEYGPPPVLRELTFFKLDDQNRLIEIDRARSARQVPGSKFWLMRDGSFWLPVPGSGGADSSVPSFPDEDLGSHKMAPFTERTVALDIAPLWLSVFGMEPQYLSLSDLRALEPFDKAPLSRGLYRTRIQVLYGEMLLPGAMALLAASLTVLLLPYSVTLLPIFGIVMAGYMAHATTKACLLMGQNGYMPAILAGWLVPAALLIASVASFRLFGSLLAQSPTARAKNRLARIAT